MLTLGGLWSALASLFVRWLTNAAVTEIDHLRANEAQRELGAAQQAAQSTLVAEAQEARARAAGDAAADGDDDPRDLLKG